MGGRILIGAPGSGSGKTLFTCGLLALLRKRGISCRSYKCGPDYIDPMFHKSVLGVQSGNLDSYFSTPEQIRARVAEETAGVEMTVIEGVMGYYDGLGGDKTQARAYHIAAITETPAILVVNGKGAGLSLAALVQGFAQFRKDSHIAAVVANRTSPMMAERLRGPLEELGVAFLGCLPELKDLQLESRHLGLVMPDEVERLEGGLHRLAEEMERHLDVERLLELAEGCGEIGGRRSPGMDGMAAAGETIAVDGTAAAGETIAAGGTAAAGETIAVDGTAVAGETAAAGEMTAMGETVATGGTLAAGKKMSATSVHPASQPCTSSIQLHPSPSPTPVPIAVARDRAFCFYYEENLRLLEQYGAKLVEFSPLKDKALPEGVCGLLLGGGYPELYGAELEANRSMRENIRMSAIDGLPVLAECGGFLYLKEGLEGTDGRFHAMAGFLKGNSKNAGRLTRFGYLELRGLPEGPVRGHEFHYWDCTENGSLCLAVKPAGGRQWPCMEKKNNVLAGFPHLYYPSNPRIPETFVETCRKYRAEREARKEGQK